MNEHTHISTWITFPWFSSFPPNIVLDLGYGSILDMNKKEKTDHPGFLFLIDQKNLDKFIPKDGQMTLTCERYATPINN